MSRRRKGIPGAENNEVAGPAREVIVAIIVVILLVAGIGSAVYFMQYHSVSGGIDYGSGGDNTNSGVSENTNPIAIINIRSEDGEIAGAVKVVLYKDKAPITVENFIKYAKDGFYNDLIFHRVIPYFVVQGGGYYYDANGDLQYKQPTYPPIQNEADNGLSNKKGTIAMARTSDPNSATSQFYFNLVDNPSLDYKDASNPGYCVFGDVIDGWGIIEQIAALPTHSESGMKDVPTIHVIIEGVTIEGA